MFCASFVGCIPHHDDETETSITYTLTLSPDLLKFVVPQVSYVDENGNIVTVTGIEELDNMVIENSTEIKKNGSSVGAWNKVVVSGTGYKCWIIKMKFNRLDFHSFMNVKYIRNEFTEDTNGKVYDFHHNIETSISSVTKTKNDLIVYQDTHVSVTLTEYHWGDNLQKYLDNLVQNPDKAGYYVDGEGHVTRKDEFDM